ncbi:oligosaccharide flippase family protein [Symbiobacterium thermophilum]|uniref:Polysaccharide biosynthesis protein n=1 Tax=Symbiobacterium thermophilum (strain DSM 24528 / JCM 14929 / IAM 14863 / T) TaxID=292459 RepID=Q67KV7_SYMTH|nr:lipopolysaccharide biosynthesis protein [Symbiobacterium thermophilum]BAD41689.1 polysaccharide biosynthesis protein [Symbiobacterium thermophilum IAM 14863]
MLIRHSFLYLGAHGVPVLIRVATLSVLTWLLTPGEYGIYTMVVAVVGMTNAVGFHWLRVSLLRFLPSAQGEGGRGALLSTIAVAYCIEVVVLSVLGGLAAIIFGFPQWILVTLLLLWTQAWLELEVEVTRVQLNPVKYGVLLTTRALLGLTLSSGLAYLGGGAIGALWGLVIANLVPAAWSYWRNRYMWVVRGFDWRVMRQIWTFGLPLATTSTLNYGVSTVDRFILGFMVGAEAAGLYAVAYDLPFQSLGALMTVTNLAGMPLAIRTLENEGIAAARRQLSANCVVLLGLGVPATLGIILLAPNVAGVFFGPEFQMDVARLIPVIAVGTLLEGVKTYYLDQAFQLAKNTLAQVGVAVLTAISKVGLTIILVHHFGLVGAAYSTVISFLIAAMLSWGVGRNIFAMPFPVGSLVKIVVATLIMGWLIAPLARYRGPLALGGQVIAGVLVYMCTAVLLNVGELRVHLINTIETWRLHRRSKATGSYSLGSDHKNDF